MNTLLTKSTLATAVALTLVACSPGSSSSLAGIGGSGYVSSGSVSGFGSVFVNGVEFETESATFDIDGIPGTQDDLAIGMVVQVYGTINDDGTTGNATSISFDDQLQGPVTGPITADKDVITKSFTVLGIPVIINSGSTTFDVSGDISTTFDFNSIDDNNHVEISGFFDSTGNLIASRVELKAVNFDDSSIVEIKGSISLLRGTTFTLGSLTVDASTASLEDLPNGLEDGLYVEVKGTLSGTTITASNVEAEDDSVEDTDEIEVEGLINNYDAINSTFTINGINVNASGATLEPTTLILGNDIRIEVEGSVVNGVLVAKEIKSEGGDIKVHAMVTAVPPATAANTFEVSPVSGQTITISVSTDTQFEDDIDENKFFNIDDLVANVDFVEVQGYLDDDKHINATEVDVKEIGEVLVQGNATDASGDASGGKITVLGITFNFDEKTDFENEDDNNLDGAGINNLINDISNNVNTPLLKIVDKKAEDGNPVGTADEIDIESE